MQLTSSAFAHAGVIPARYTCDGANVNPPLAGHILAQTQLMGRYDRPRR